MAEATEEAGAHGDRALLRPHPAHAGNYQRNSLRQLIKKNKKNPKQLYFVRAV